MRWIVSLLLTLSSTSAWAGELAALADIRVYTYGAWAEDEEAQLDRVLRQLDADRPRRPADIFEWSYATSLGFVHGDSFAYRLEDDSAPNPAAIWGNGFSGFITHQFTLAKNASDEELKAFIKPRLPDVLIRDEERRQAWHEDLAQAARADRSFCARLFGAFARAGKW